MKLRLSLLVASLGAVSAFGFNAKQGTSVKTFRGQQNAGPFGKGGLSVDAPADSKFALNAAAVASSSEGAMKAPGAEDWAASTFPS